MTTNIRIMIPVTPIAPKPSHSIDVKAIRHRIERIVGEGESQRAFATAIGVSIRTLENWEQGRRKPTGPARVLLRLVEHDPDIVLKIKHTPKA